MKNKFKLLATVMILVIFSLACNMSQVTQFFGEYPGFSGA